MNGPRPVESVTLSRVGTPRIRVGFGEGSVDRGEYRRPRYKHKTMVLVCVVRL